MNFELLKNFQNQNVRLVGEVTSTSGNLLHVKAADGGMVDVKLSGQVLASKLCVAFAVQSGTCDNEFWLRMPLALPCLA